MVCRLWSQHRRGGRVRDVATARRLEAGIGWSLKEFITTVAVKLDVRRSVAPYGAHADLLAPHN